MIKIVFLRHGESLWNKANLFTGWTDIGLSTKGKAEAKEAQKTLQQKNYEFDLVFQSLMKRAHETTKLVLGRKKIKTISDWRLNERHYGNLQGMDKNEIREKYGDKQFMLWRRGYSVRPPQITKKNPTYDNVYNNPNYKSIKIPKTESLADVVKRATSFWQDQVVPELKTKKKILISAHGNSLRALIKHLDKVSVKDITDLNLPTGIPLVYELDDKFKPIRHYYLGDSKKIQAAVDKVKKQGKK